MKLIKPLFFLIALVALSGCVVTGSTSTNIGGLFSKSNLPSCSNVRGRYTNNTPLGAERVGSRLWVERRVIYTSQVGGVVRQVAARRPDGQWQAPKDMWQVTLNHGLVSQYTYDVNFNVRAEKTGLSSNRLQRRHVEVFLHIFGPKMGAYGREYNVDMVALKYRGAPDSDWVICPSN